MNGLNEMEETIFTILKNQYGQTWQAMDESVVQTKIDLSNKLYESSVKSFRNNPSASNYNILVTAMMALQYWTQKRVKSFTTSEDF